MFDKLPKCHVAIWNAIITGCTGNGPKDVASYLFKGMHWMDIQPANYTFAGMLRLCSLDLELVRNSMVNSLITMYFKCSCVFDAYCCIVICNPSMYTNLLVLL